MPNFFMREISVVRLIRMRAAHSEPPTRPLVSVRARTISSRRPRQQSIPDQTGDLYERFSIFATTVYRGHKTLNAANAVDSALIQRSATYAMPLQTPSIKEALQRHTSSRGLGRRCQN
jgi:hypothetical protein